MWKKAEIFLPKSKYAKNVSYNIVDGKIEVYYDVEDKFDPKDGDFLHNESRLTTVIYKETHPETGGIVTYAGARSNTITYITDRGWGYTSDFRYATEQEKKELLDKLSKIGKRWNPETKQIEDIRWRAEKMKEYYCIEEYNNEVLLVYDLYVRTDNKRYESGNYFRTPEAARKVADQIKDIFKNSKPE